MPVARLCQLVLIAAMLAPAASMPTAAQDAVRAMPPPSEPGQATDETVRAAVAAVLVATLGGEFDAMLELRLGDPTVEVAGPRDHVVHGLGELRFDGAGEDWLAFRYRARFDPVTATAGYPEIRLGAGGEGSGERFVPNDAGLLVELEALVAAELESFPGAGRVTLQLDDVSSLQSGRRFLQVEAEGLADFGPVGRTGARVDALYDLQSNAWLRIVHALGPDAHAQDLEGATAGP